MYHLSPPPEWHSNEQDSQVFPETLQHAMDRLAAFPGRVRNTQANGPHIKPQQAPFDIGPNSVTLLPCPPPQDPAPPMPETSPFRPLDDEARATLRTLLGTATHAALAVLQPGTTAPSVTRIALATTAEGAPLSLISSLSSHTQALEAHQACALLIGEPGDKGDPLTHPRLTLHATARLIARDTAEHTTLRARYLAERPKAKLYADFGDFRFVTFDITDGLLNAGFGKAYLIGAADIGNDAA